MPAIVAVNSDFSKQTRLLDGNYTSTDLQSFKNFLIDRNGNPRLSAYETDSNSKICLYTDDNFVGLITQTYLPNTGRVTNMEDYNDKVKSLKIIQKDQECFQNDTFNNTEYFQNQPSNNTNFYLFILLLIFVYFYFIKK